MFDMNIYDTTKKIEDIVKKESDGDIATESSVYVNAIYKYIQQTEVIDERLTLEIIKEIICYCLVLFNLQVSKNDTQKHKQDASIIGDSFILLSKFIPSDAISDKDINERLHFYTKTISGEYQPDLTLVEPEVEAQLVSSPEGRHVNGLLALVSCILFKSEPVDFDFVYSKNKIIRQKDAVEFAFFIFPSIEALILSMNVFLLKELNSLSNAKDNEIQSTASARYLNFQPDVIKIKDNPNGAYATIIKKCEFALERTEANPLYAIADAEGIIATAPQLIVRLQAEDTGVGTLNECKDLISLTLGYCAAAYGNVSIRWDALIPILQEAKKYAVSPKAKDMVEQNLKIVNQNISVEKKENKNKALGCLASYAMTWVSWAVIILIIWGIISLVRFISGA